MAGKALTTLTAVAAAVTVSVTGVAWGQTAQGVPKPEPAKTSPAAPAPEVKAPEAKAPEVKQTPVKVTTVTGKVKSVGTSSLVVQLGGKTPKEMTFDLSGTTIRAAGKHAAVSDLKDGDHVRVGYTEADGKLIAKTVSATRAKAKK